jgi:hypothetical protein
MKYNNLSTALLDRFRHPLDRRSEPLIPSLLPGARLQRILLQHIIKIALPWIQRKEGLGNLTLDNVIYIN